MTLHSIAVVPIPDLVANAKSPAERQALAAILSRIDAPRPAVAAQAKSDEDEVMKR